MTAPKLNDDFKTNIAANGLLGVAVSGGGDSMALLHMLLQAGASVSVASVNHNLRPEAADETRAVADFCAACGVPHEVLQWHWDGQGNLQDQARRGRYAVLVGWAKRVAVNGVALGHTADDNIETFMMELSRGAGLDGLSGMRPEFVRDGVTFYRPLLNARRDALRDMLRDVGINWSDDPSNDDPSYQRIQVRQNMDALSAVGITTEQVLKSLGNLQSTRRDVNADLVAALKGHFAYDRGDLCFDLTWLENLSSESQRRIVSSALQFVSGQEYAPRGSKLMRLLADLRQKSTLHGCVISVWGDQLRIGRELSAVSQLSTPSNELWDNRWQATGKHGKTTEIRALGEVGLSQCPNDWRETEMPRTSVLASPSVWEEAVLIAAPLAGYTNNWSITLRERGFEYPEFILSH
ncbi:MAG: tRNA lysidine(34) synthetase TilS [Litoreibacter sp.]|uniref:tRNA lysidine(34) synthetase TilS n=1 Tax=Litoreibacter sp. TaxID=1969459 RepID=UPI00329793B3